MMDGSGGVREEFVIPPGKTYRQEVSKALGQGPPACMGMHCPDRARAHAHVARASRRFPTSPRTWICSRGLRIPGR